MAHRTADGLPVTIRKAGFFAMLRLQSEQGFHIDKVTTMKVSEILQVKGNILYTATPEMALLDAVNIMAEKDIGSLVVMEYGDLVGMLTFREVMQALHKNGGSVGGGTVRKHMDDHPLTVTPDTEVNEVRRMMLEKHARYLPVMNAKTLLGVISFYDVARAVLEAQSFENRMLKAYIRDWPTETAQED
jgi:CBS domain-containing protein